MTRLIATLAHWRVTLGFVFGAAVIWLARPTPQTLVVGIPFIITGEALRVWAAGHLNKSREVTSSGPYRWFAHPLYVGSSIMGVGVAFAADHAIVSLLIAIYLASTLTAAIKNEEAFLRRTFGDEYVRYRRGGRGGEGAGAARAFSWSQARANREHRTIAGVAAAILLLVVKSFGLFNFNR